MHFVCDVLLPPSSSSVSSSGEVGKRYGKRLGQNVDTNHESIFDSAAISIVRSSSLISAIVEYYLLGTGEHEPLSQLQLVREKKIKTLPFEILVKHS